MNALSQCGVFMEEPPECLTDSVDRGPEGCSVRGKGFEPCRSFKLDVRQYTLELSNSVSNLPMHFSVVCFVSFLCSRVRCLSASDFRSSILVRLFANSFFIFRHCIFEPSQLSDLGGGRVVRWCWVNFQCRGVLQF